MSPRPHAGSITAFKWLGTALQLAGCLIVALHEPWSGYAFPVMLVGSAIWAVIATQNFDWPLVTLNVAFSAINLLGIWRWLGA